MEENIKITALYERFSSGYKNFMDVMIIFFSIENFTNNSIKKFSKYIYKYIFKYIYLCYDNRYSIILER